MLRSSHLKKIGLVLSVALVFTACRKDKVDSPSEDADNAVQEYKFVRVLVSDQFSSKLSLLDPFSAKVATFDAKYPLANLYGTASGRYAAVLYQSQNLVEVFDAGLASHVDHIDRVNDPRWASITGDGLKPTHFKSKGAESLIFNDGDGTLSAANETDFNKSGAKFSLIKAGLLPHHGAMAQYTNGNYAVTSAAVSGGSPTRVLVINKSGGTVFPSTMETGAIHGNATDGSTAVFGAFTNAAASAGGALVVSASGEQKFIPNPEGFGAFRLGTIYYAESAKKFIGYVATKGAYLIDVPGNKMTAIYTGNDAFQCKVDYAGKNLLVLTLDGKLRIYDLASGSLTKEGTVISAVTSTDTYKPVLEATRKYAYIAMPALGQVHQVDLRDFTKVTKHSVSSNPVRLALFGFESSAEHE